MKLISVEQSGELFDRWIHENDVGAKRVSDLLLLSMTRRLRLNEIGELAGLSFAAGLVAAQKAQIDAEAADALADFPTTEMH